MEKKQIDNLTLEETGKTQAALVEDKDEHLLQERE